MMKRRLESKVGWGQAEVRVVWVVEVRFHLQRWMGHKYALCNIWWLWACWVKHNQSRLNSLKQISFVGQGEPGGVYKVTKS
jgi:hypothetical protein